MSKTELRARSEVVGTSVGLLVFLAGVGLLIFVFVLALGLFHDPGILTAAAATPPGAEAAGGVPVAGTLMVLGARILFLFVMVLAASVLTSKGVHLYLASR